MVCKEVKKYGLNGVIVRSLPDNLKQLDEESLGDSYKYVHNMPEHLKGLGRIASESIRKDVFKYRRA